MESLSKGLFYRNHAWTAAAATTSVLPLGPLRTTRRRRQLRIATFNILFDRAVRPAFQEVVACAEERFRHALDLLKETNADIIALQEVTPHFVHHLLCEGWVQDRYYVSSDALHPSLQPFGQYTLSTLPIERVEAYTFGKLGIKRCLFTTVALDETDAIAWSEQAANTRFQDSERKTGSRRSSSPLPLDVLSGSSMVTAPLGRRLLTFANLHLTADQHGVTTFESTRQRRGQLRRIFQLLDERYVDSHDRFLLGDFNFGDDSEENQNLDPTYCDLWRSVHSSTPAVAATATAANTTDSAGYTCDRFHNRITQLLCPTGKPVRTDRILMRSMYWIPEACDIILDRPFQVDGRDVFPSDHFGVCASVAVKGGDNRGGGISSVGGDGVSTTTYESSNEEPECNQLS